MVVLHIGDVVGRPGRNALVHLLPALIAEHDPALVIVNGENIAGGTGITAATAEELFAAGADCVTTGNHIWAQKGTGELLDRDSRVLRPANYPPGAPGGGAVVLPVRRGDLRVGVICLLGRVFMRELDCPFRGADAILSWMRDETPAIIVDFHAEATSEKEAMGRYLDGRVSAVLGTHTHVQTADERVLPKGTAFICDVGMTGPYDSVLGRRTDRVIQATITQMPHSFDVAKGDVRISGAQVTFDPATGLASAIERVQVREDQEI